MTRGAGQGPPRLAGPRAARHRRGQAQAGRAAGHRRHQQPRAGHRHGRRRPRHPGRVAGRGQPRPAAHRPGRPPGRRAEPGLDLPQAPRRPAGGGGRRAADARRADRVDPLPAQPARRAGPADRRPHGPGAARRPSPSWPPSCAGRPTSPRSPTSSSPTRSTCWPAATRARSSPSCGRGSCGTGSTTRSGPATGPSGWPSRRGGTIPDRGLFGVFLPDGTRVGELDEEMVYESRPGETFVLGASTWRIEDITFQKVTVTPAPGEPGKMPFWHGDRPGRPLELGRALGAFVRELRELPPAKATDGAARGLRPRRAGRGQPPAVRHRAGRGDRRRARRPHDRRRALPGRDRRLAHLPAQPVRHARCTRRGRWPSSAG